MSDSVMSLRRLSLVYHKRKKSVAQALSWVGLAENACTNV